MNVLWMHYDGAVNVKRYQYFWQNFIMCTSLWGTHGYKIPTRFLLTGGYICWQNLRRILKWFRITLNVMKQKEGDFHIWLSLPVYLKFKSPSAWISLASYYAFPCMSWATLWRRFEGVSFGCHEQHGPPQSFAGRCGCLKLCDPQNSRWGGGET